GNPLANQSVNFSASNGATIGATQTTDASGMAKMTLTSTVAGTSDVTASINGSNQSVTATFVADVSTATIENGAMTVVANDAITNGIATNSVKVMVTDANGNPLAGQTVSFTADNGATIVPAGTTAADGSVTITLTSQTIGVSNVTATVNGHSQNVATTFVATPQLNSMIITGGQTTVVAGTTSNTFSATFTDANTGLALKNTPVSVSLSVNNAGKFSDSGTATTTATVTTDASGVALLPGIIGTTIGTDTVTATLDGVSKTAALTITADYANPILQRITLTTRTGGDGRAQYVLAYIVDPYNNVLNDSRVTVYQTTTGNLTLNNSISANGESGSYWIGNHRTFAYTNYTSGVATISVHSDMSSSQSIAVPGD
ncbi:hypothetical protein FH968_23490, partial [Buttiauxella sp. B2]|uniref:Ig-like domain-containing protein n=1 Tax=Buttiauxella sp. B2 TaxID=2587812 RepID=UPI00116E6D5D